MARNKPAPDTVLGHAAEADGIEEYDNKLPNWWLWTFYFTIVVGIWMMIDWHVLNDRTLADVYAAEVAAAEERFGDRVSLAPTDILITADTVAGGAALFAEHCVRCHGENATGYIGPNLTDAVWIHGGTPAEIAYTIYEGVPRQSMPRWGPELGVENVALLAAFVHNLGSNDIGAADGAE